MSFRKRISIPHAAQQQLGQRKDEKPTQYKDHPSQIKGVPRARRCRRTPQHSRDQLTGESPKESRANIFLRLSDFHHAPIIEGISDEFVP